MSLFNLPQMNIGFDAKRAFLNQSGLGNYSRTLIKSLCSYFPNHHYNLYTTSKTNNLFSEYVSKQKNITVHEPQSFIDKKVKSKWRSYGISNLLNEHNINVYHGLSNELPFNIHKFRGKKVVTVHDLIFLRYPKLYSAIDRNIYNKKFKSTCDAADVIIAVSEQTKKDIQEFYFIPAEKIKVIYQSCDEQFQETTSPEVLINARKKYSLPENYLLYVGTIEERKNLLTILKALRHIKEIPLVVIGKKRAYFKKITDYISEKKLNNRIIFPENVLNEDLPAIYSGAEIFIYPSVFEGFGIPVLEALTSKVPVITSKGSCFAEAGGPDSIYIDTLNEEELTFHIEKITASSELRREMQNKGLNYAQKFRTEIVAKQIMNLYIE